MFRARRVPPQERTGSTGAGGLALFRATKCRHQGGRHEGVWFRATLPPVLRRDGTRGAGGGFRACGCRSQHVLAGEDGTRGLVRAAWESASAGDSGLVPGGICRHAGLRAASGEEHEGVWFRATWQERTTRGFGSGLRFFLEELRPPERTIWHEGVSSVCRLRRGRHEGVWFRATCRLRRGRHEGVRFQRLRAASARGRHEGVSSRLRAASGERTARGG